ncbi:MAG: hypothetical protein ACRD4K_10095 [Candidatus Acidiferrales bacterium]
MPVQVSHDFFLGLKTAPKHTASNQMTGGTNAATKNQPERIVSLPNFSKSFTFDGVNYPYTMLGGRPRKGDTTQIPVTYIPMSFFFDEFVDNNGNNIVIDTTLISDQISQSPLFRRSDYTTGRTQFQDAVQRAEFWNIINHEGDHDGDHDDDNDWHTLLTRPRTLIPVTIEVPVGASIVFQDAEGTIGTLIDINFIVSQLNTLVQTEGITVDTFPLFVTRNAVYGDFDHGNPVDCCIGGFHTAFETNQVGNKIFVQVIAFSTALDSDLANFIFGDPTVFADVNALSHEVAETFNDPFVNNQTPKYQIPGAPPGVCQANLETGDVIEFFTPDFFPVTLNGFTYHPQVEGLLQWFEGKAPSDAIGGAYSYPDTTFLTSPFTPCPHP